MRSSMGVLWDVDGTLVESTDLAFVATNEVLEANGFSQITVEQYKVGCKFTTPDRCLSLTVPSIHNVQPISLEQVQ